MVDGKGMKLPTPVQWAGTCRVCHRCSRLIDSIEFLKVSDIFIQRENTITNIRRSEKVDVRTVLAGTYHSVGGTYHADTTRSVASTQTVGGCSLPVGFI